MATPTSTPPARSRRAGPGHRLQVLRTERLTPHLVRVVLGGPGLAGVADSEYTDRYVKLAFPRPGVSYPEPFDVGAIRETMPRADWPISRTYTIRSLDRDAGELVIDFVVHGDLGVAGPWALAAQPGDVLVFLGPGGAYAPSPEVDAHVLVGDESALPAIAAALERMPAGADARVFVAVDDADDEIPLDTPARLSLRWLHRGRGDDLVAAVRDAAWPEGTVQAFVHGETGAVKALRGIVLDDHGVARERLSISGYWRRGADEEAFQDLKRVDREAGTNADR